MSDFGEALVRVLKKVQRKSSNGQSKTTQQAFHVRKAAPGDQYAAARQPSTPSTAQAKQQAMQAQQPMEPAPVDPATAADMAPPPARIGVRFHDVPWRKKTKREEEDPIPAIIRKRFDKTKGVAIFSNPSAPGIPVITVIPTDRIFWGGDEPDVLVALRSGQIRKMRLVGSNGMMVVKIDAMGGGAFYAYMWMESLRCPLLPQIWGDLINFSTDGTLSRRAACAYEAAKACGLDDLTPPTTLRLDSEGDVRAMLPDSLIEQSQALEWVARQTGKNKDEIRKEIGAYATVQLIRGETWPIEKEGWFRDLFGKPSNADALNNIWLTMPADRRIAFLRSACLDFVVGSLDRSWGDFVFSDDPRHPLMIYGGELTCPCPRKIGLSYATGNYVGYADHIGPDTGGIPLFWSEISTMLATRGQDAEINDFEQIGISVASRMKDDRGVEMARALLEYRLPVLQIAGVLSRIWMLQTHSRDIAKDPYFSARYYATLVAGQPDPQMDGVRDFVNAVMKRVLVGDFSFYKMMRSEKDDDASPS